MVAPTGLGIAEVSYTSGSGPYTLAGSPAGSLRFRDVFASGQVVTVRVRDGNQYEESRALFTAPDLLTVVTVQASSSGGDKIDWPAFGLRVVEYVPEIVSRAQVSMFWPDNPGAGQVIEVPIAEDLSFPAGFPRSLARCRTGGPTADAEIVVNKIVNGVTTQIGTVTFAAGVRDGSWMSWGGASQYVPHGSYFQFVFPTPADLTFADIALAAWGSRI